MTEIKALIFDKDGTLFDFRRSWGGWAERVLDDLSRDPGHLSVLAQAIGYDPVARAFHADSIVIAGTTAEIAAVLHPHLSGRKVDELADHLNGMTATATMVPATALRPLFEGLRASGLRLGLATNDAEAPARAHLAGAGVADLFDFVAGYDSGWGGKPAPGQLLAFAAAGAAPPAEIAMVGDSLHDLHAARAAGMGAVAVLTGIAGAEVLAPHADVVLPDISHLPGWLQQRAG